MKLCHQCKKEKTESEFSYLKSVNRLCSWCKSCNSKKSTEWYSKNVEKARVARRHYYFENQEHFKKKAKEYVISNREKVKLTREKWRKNNKDKVNASSIRKKAARLRATPIWADHSIIERIYSEATILSEKTGREYHVDHIVPLRAKLVCGLHWEKNLQILERHDNLIKSNLWWPDMPSWFSCHYWKEAA